MIYCFEVRTTSDEQMEEMRVLAGVYDTVGAKSTYISDTIILFYIPDQGRAANFRLFYDEYITGRTVLNPNDENELINRIIARCKTR